MPSALGLVLGGGRVASSRAVLPEWNPSYDSVSDRRQRLGVDQLDIGFGLLTGLSLRAWLGLPQLLWAASLREAIEASRA